MALEEHPERLAVTGARTRPQNGVIDVHRLFMSQAWRRLDKPLPRGKADSHPEVQASSALALTHGFQIGLYVLTGLLLFGALIAATLVKPRPPSPPTRSFTATAAQGPS